MKIEIIKVNSKEMAFKANNYLTKLIHDEKKYDENINEKCIVKSLYERVYMNDNVCILLAKYDDEYAGYLFGNIIDTNDAYINAKAKLDAIFIDEKYRKKQIGKKLINEFEYWVKSKGLKYIELTVCKENTPAICLYKNYGFKDAKTIMQYTIND